MIIRSQMTDCDSYDEDAEKRGRIQDLERQIRAVETHKRLATQGKVAVDPKSDQKRVELELRLEDARRHKTKSEKERDDYYESHDL